MANNQKFKQRRVNTLPTTGLVAGDLYSLNVGGGKYKNFIVSDTLNLVSESGAEFIEKDTMAQMRLITPREIWAIQQGYYKGVKLNGYYTKGDTPAPIEYYLSDTTESDDEGSIIEVGGIKLEHIFDEDINTLYFGLKLNNSDETLKIVNLFNAAGKHQSKVSFGGQGTKLRLKPTTPIEILTSVDFNNVRIQVDDYTNQTTLFTIKSTNLWKDVTSYTQSDFTIGQDKSDSFNNYEHHLINITSTEVLCNRIDGGVSSPEYKKDTIYVGKSGFFPESNLIHDFTQGTLTIKARAYDETTIVIENVNIDWSMSSGDNYSRVFSIDRSNTIFKNIKVNVSGNTVATDYRRYIFSLTNGYNNYFENIQSENVALKSGTSGYVFLMNKCIKTTFRNIIAVRGWGTFGTNDIKGLIIENSTINRLDVHINFYNMDITNTTFLGGWGIFLGYGKGSVNITNCKSDFSLLDGTTSMAVVRIPTGYGLTYTGIVNIDNHHVITRGTGSKALMYLQYGDAGDYKVAYDIQLPTLIARNIFFHNTDGEVLYGYYWYNDSIRNIATTLQLNSKFLWLSKNITIKDVYIDVESDTSYFCAYWFISHNSLNNYVKGSTTIRLENINIKLHSYYESLNYPSSYTGGEILKPLIYTTERQAAVLGYKHNVYVSNCTGGVDFQTLSREVVITESKVSYDTYYNSTFYAERTKVYNSDVYLLLLANKTKAFLSTDYAELVNNAIWVLRSEGANMELFDSPLPTLSINNSFRGNSASITTAQLRTFSNFHDASRLRKSFNPAIAVTSPSVAPPVADTASSATDVAGLVVDLNDLISKYNTLLSSYIDTRTVLTNKLSADRNAGQQIF